MSCESDILGSNKTLGIDMLRGNEEQGSPEITKYEFLDLKPVRNSALRWEKNQQGFIILFVPLKQPQKKRRKSIFSMLSSTSQEKKIRLDGMGSVIWELCDGEKTVKYIVQFLNEKFLMHPSEAEISLKTYLIHLSKRGFITFIAPKELNEHLEEASKK